MYSRIIEMNMLNLLIKKIFFILSLFFLQSCSITPENSAVADLSQLPDKYAETLFLANNGDQNAQLSMGEIYHYGDNSKRDLEKAFYWYEKAAKQGLEKAQNLLGMFYAGGVGVKQDCGSAVKWFKYAYFNGSKSSKSNLAWLLATCEQDQYRDGTLAVQLARESLAEIGVNVPGLDNLAAALAETGDFKNAVDIQVRLVNILQDLNQPERLSRYKARLSSYRNNKPWRGASYVDQENYIKEGQ